MQKAKKLPSGNWRVIVDLGKDISGKRRRKSVTAPTKKEAEFLAASLRMDTPSPDDCTVAEAVEGYITNRSSVLSPSTIRGYRQIQRNYYDSINDIKVSELQSETVQRLINNISSTHSPKSTRNIYALLLSSLVAFNPDVRLFVNLPQKKPVERHIPTDKDIKTLLDEANPYLRKAILLASTGTLRRGEICSLKYSDITGNVIHVHSDMVHDENNNWIVKEIPKTSSSDRYIELPGAVIESLSTGNEFIIGKNPDNITSSFCRLRNRLCINTRFHDLRHYAASIMHAIGVPDQYIMEVGGWSSDTVLKSVYRNILDDKQKEFSQMRNDYFNDILF